VNKEPPVPQARKENRAYRVSKVQQEQPEPKVLLVQKVLLGQQAPKVILDPPFLILVFYCMLRMVHRKSPM